MRARRKERLDKLYLLQRDLRWLHHQLNIMTARSDEFLRGNPEVRAYVRERRQFAASLGEPTLISFKDWVGVRAVKAWNRLQEADLDEGTSWSMPPGDPPFDGLATILMAVDHRATFEKKTYSPCWVTT